MGSVPQLKSLTSLRFFAALAVCLFHVPWTLPSAFGATQIFPSGAFGVGFFFVLSGFILAHTVDRAPWNTQFFYLKRFARIYPLHLLTLTAWIALFFTSWGIPPADKINSGIANILLLQAAFIGPAFNLGYNAVSWSLSVEMFFYLLFPLLRSRFFAAGAVATHLLFVAALGIQSVQSIEASAPSFFYFNPLARLAEFCLGILASDLARRTSLRSFGTPAELAAIIGVIVAISYSHLLPSSLKFVALGLPFAALICVFSKEAGFFSKLLAGRGFVLLGDASFALYMTHHMLFRLTEKGLHGIVGGWLLVGTAIGAAIVVSILVYKLFEQPMRTLIVSSYERKTNLPEIWSNQDSNLLENSIQVSDERKCEAVS
jgi:peptidoglycan/LPS O-acetylase OafA/YrhL